MGDKTDLGVVALDLGQFADSLHEAQCLPEVAQAKRALDPARVVNQRPVRRLGAVALRFQ